MVRVADPADPEELLVIAGLRRQGEYQCSIPGNDRAAIERARSLGRRAGRRIGWKVRTFETPHAGGATVVTVVVTDSSPLHQRLLRARGARALGHIYPKPPDPPR